MAASRRVIKIVGLLSLILGIGALWLAPAAQAQAYYYPHVYNAYGWYPPAVYTPDGRAVVYYPYGVPRGVRRSYFYPGVPNPYWAGFYPPVPAPVAAPAAVPAGSPAGFQGPFWHYTAYRRPRGLFRRSSWRAALVPYYVAPTVYAPGYWTVPSYPYTYNPTGVQYPPAVQPAPQGNLKP